MIGKAFERIFSGPRRRGSPTCAASSPRTPVDAMLTDGLCYGAGLLGELRAIPSGDLRLTGRCRTPNPTRRRSAPGCCRCTDRWVGCATRRSQDRRGMSSAARRRATGASAPTSTCRPGRRARPRRVATAAPAGVHARVRIPVPRPARAHPLDRRTSPDPVLRLDTAQLVVDARRPAAGARDPGQPAAGPGRADRARRARLGRRAGPGGGNDGRAERRPRSRPCVRRPAARQLRRRTVDALRRTARPRRRLRRRTAATPASRWHWRTAFRSCRPVPPRRRRRSRRASRTPASGYGSARHIPRRTGSVPRCVGS